MVRKDIGYSSTDRLQEILYYHRRMVRLGIQVYCCPCHLFEVPFGVTLRTGFSPASGPRSDCAGCATVRMHACTILPFPDDNSVVAPGFGMICIDRLQVCLCDNEEVHYF